jgi:hypothetical protein
MEKNVRDQLSTRLRRAVMAVVASGIVTASAVHANPSNNIVVVPPTDLPELARHSGDAMLLHETVDGRILLYIEQDQGARLATFDVTNPVHIKDEGSVKLDVSGPFDFVSPLGKQAELIRLRQGHEYSVLDLHKERVPNIKPVQGLTLQGPIARPGDDGFTVTHQATDMKSDRDIQVVETANTRDLSRVFDVKQVREEVLNADTGTTFLLTEKGLFLIRRPAMEWNRSWREREWFIAHNGG